MASTIVNARNEILTLFKTQWEADPLSASIQVFYDDVKGDVPQTGDDDTFQPSPFARVKIEHTTGGQSTLSGSIGTRTFTRNGLITVQVFTPSGQGLSLADQLVSIVVHAFEGSSTPSQVWFRNVRANEIGKSGPWFQYNVLSDFTYDEIR